MLFTSYLGTRSMLLLPAQQYCRQYKLELPDAQASDACVDHWSHHS
jgi:hypothetical protein